MKTSINLYQAQFKPELSLISLGSVVFFNLLVLALFIALFGFLSWRNGDLTDENRRLAEAVSLATENVARLETELKNKKPDSQLLATIEQQKIALAQRQRLMQELANREDVKMNRFSEVLNDLNKADTQTVWLTKIHLDHQAVAIAGYGSTADAMPKWLANLGQTESFKGMAFDNAKMRRDDTAIGFELNTQLAEAATTAGSR